MLSRNNFQERLRKMEQKNEHFSLRKLTVGVASVLVGLSFLGFTGNNAKAATTDKLESANKSTTGSVDDQTNLNVKTSSNGDALTQSGKASVKVATNADGSFKGFSSNGDALTQSTLPEAKSSNGDALTQPALPAYTGDTTKTSSNGDALTQPGLPTVNGATNADGSFKGFSSNGDALTQPTLPEAKSSNGDALTQPALPAYTGDTTKTSSNGDALTQPGLPTVNGATNADGSFKGLNTNGDALTQPALPAYTGDTTKTSSNGDALTQPGLPTVNGATNADGSFKGFNTNGDAATQPALPTFNGGVAGIPETQPALPVKLIIVYKDNDGKVVGTQYLDGKVGDKVTPKIPDGYVATKNVDNVTIPADGIITINVTKKESSNGDALTQPALPAFNGGVAGNPTTQPALPAYTGNVSGNQTSKPTTGNTATTDTPATPAGQPVETNKGTEAVSSTENKKVNNVVKENAASLNNSSVAHTNFYNTTNGNKKATLPQTGAKTNMAGLLGLMIASVGAVFGLAADKKRKN